MAVIKLTAEQSANLPFPIGCPVWYNFSGNKNDNVNMKRGVIKSASLQNSQIYYEVTYCDDDKNIAITEEVEGTNLGFGSSCPVTISPYDKSGGSPLEGEIVMCSADPNNNNNVVYTAMIFTDGCQFRYESDIDASRVTYREKKVQDNQSNEENISNSNAISASTKQIADRKEENKMDATPPLQSTTQRYVPSSITCSDSVSKRSFTESNDDAVDSSEKRARYPIIAKNEGNSGHHAPDAASTSQDSTNVTPPSHSKFPNVPKLEITPPLWLQKDRSSQRNLFFHLLGKGDNINRINQESQCRVHLEMKDAVFAPMKIFIEALRNSTAQQDLLLARQMIQDLFLDYVGNDGCRGRLLCEIAQSCWGPHRPSNSTSSAVRNVNPFLDNRLTYMSIVEMSYEEHMNEKSFHAAHILHKPLLCDITNLGCDLILVAKGFRTSTNKCDPYVFVYGRKYQDVDKAVQLVKEKIRDHQHVCGKCVMG